MCVCVLAQNGLHAVFSLLLILPENGGADRRRSLETYWEVLGPWGRTAGSSKGPRPVEPPTPKRERVLSPSPLPQPRVVDAAQQHPVSAAAWGSPCLVRGSSQFKFPGGFSASIQTALHTPSLPSSTCRSQLLYLCGLSSEAHTQRV